MKKFIFSFTLLAVFASTSSYAASCPVPDYVGYSQMRYGNSYTFADTFSNPNSSTNLYLW